MKTPNTKIQTPRERPILFSGEMVRAILDGRKTQTRRIMKPQPSESFLPGDVGMYYPTLVDKDGEQFPGPVRFGVADENEDYPFKLGIIGSHLWVKETFQPLWATEEPGDYKTGKGYNINYVATGGIKDWAEGGEGELTQKCTPSIFMPRWASRITLEILSVRVERLQAINEADAKAEGISERTTIAGVDFEVKRVSNYAHLWESINGPGSWAKNPWVWVIEFRKL